MQQNNARQEKKESIYRAALSAYQRYGIQAATAKQIAEIAHIGKSTIFEYFKSTDELMDEAIIWYIKEDYAVWDRLHNLAKSIPATALSVYFDNLIKTILTEPRKALLLWQYATAILASSTDFSEVKMQYVEKLQPTADALLQEFRFIVDIGISSRAFRPIGMDAGDCALMLNAIVKEMQAQAFVADQSQIRNNCRKLKHMAFAMLGVDDKTGTNGD